MEKKEDRRIRITKKAIRDSLIELMQRHPISKISVKMICDGADINRSTFYAHYRDQDELLEKLQQEAVQGVKAHLLTTSFIQQSESAAPAIVKMLEYCRDNSALFKVLLRDNGDTVFQRELMGLVREKSLQEIREDHQLDEGTTRYLELFALHGILSMVCHWLEEGCLDAPEQLANLMAKLLYEGIFGLFR